VAQQTLDFVIAQQVTGQADVARLIKSVGALDAEMQKLRSATQGMGSGFQQAAGAIRGNTNVLDAQSKALRNQRQGIQQVGMQLNDFATSVSTGASVSQAFNQQLGQLGFAMSMMQGRAATVGRFLAGPWGAAITIAVAAAGYLFNTMSSAEEPSNAFIDALEASRDALFDYKKEIAGTRQELVALYETKLAGLQADFREASVNAGRFGREAQDANKIMNDAINQPLWKVARSWWNGSDAAENYTKNAAKATELSGQIIRLETSLASMRKGFAREDEAARNRASRSAESAAAKLATQQEREMEQAQAIAEKIRDMGLTYGASNKQIGETAKRLDDFNDMVTKLQTLSGGPAIARELAATIDMVRQAIVGQGAEKALNAFNAEVDKLIQKDLSPFERSIANVNAALADPELLLDPEGGARYYEALSAAARPFFDDAIKGQQDLIDKANGVDNAFKMQVQSLEQIIASMRAAGAPTAEFESMLGRINQLQAESKVAEKNREIQNSYEAIGTAVANSFKGMITGAQSFGDAMRGIIQSVIDELFRLFVVQQIVGFISSAASGAFGGGPSTPSGLAADFDAAFPRRALGGSVGQGKPYLVGERGPELFMPGRSGTIIPTQNSRTAGGGSTINVSVDARGATSPEMVRQQVQQGILEAAPSIVAAAEQRTISTLRRPRLAGVM
jgi:hypothetical protein